MAYGSWFMVPSGKIWHLDLKVCRYGKTPWIWAKRLISSQKVFKDEIYVLSSQIKRAADSVVLNIAEGSTGQSKAVFKVFLTYALRSGIEVVSGLFIGKKRGYINDDTFSHLYNEYETLVKKITALKNSL